MISNELTVAGTVPDFPGTLLWLGLFRPACARSTGFEIAGSRGRQGEVLGVFARGGRGRQVLVIIDGVRVNDPSSFSQEYDLRLLSASQVASIEIVKGAASTLYGTNAATAVINITTKSESSRKVGGEIQSSIGTNQTSDDQNYRPSEFINSVNLGGTLNKFTYSLAFANTYVDGMSSIATDENEEDRTRRNNFDLRLGYKFTEDLGLSIYANKTELDTEYDESFGLMDAPYEFKSDQQRIGLAFNWKYDKGELVFNSAYSDYSSENISNFPGTFEGSNYVADLYAKYVFKDQFYTILGLNYINDKASFTEKGEFTLVDPYANLVYVSEVGLNVNGGLRWNNHSEYGSEFVYSLNPSYTFNTDDGYWKLITSYATSYITPSLTQLFGDFGANPELEPESNRTIEAGVEYALKSKLRTNILYFNRVEENFVFFDGNSFQFLNAENTIDAQGVEFELDWQIIPSLQFATNYTFTERKGDNAIRIPKHKLNALIGYDFSERSLLSLTYSYTGERSDTDFNTFEDIPLDPYSLFGINYTHKLFNDSLKVFVNIDNIFNTDYTEVIGFNTRGRNIRIGLGWSF